MEKMERKNCPKCGAKMSLVYEGPVVRKKDKPIGFVCTNCWYLEKAEGIFFTEVCTHCGKKLVPEFVTIGRDREAVPYSSCIGCGAMFKFSLSVPVPA